MYNRCSLLHQIYSSKPEVIMAFMINDSCINCGYCEKECPNQAIYEPGMSWSMSEGTKLMGVINLKNGLRTEASKLLDPLSADYYFIVPDKCSECQGVSDKPQCRVVCPDPESITVLFANRESQEELLARQKMLGN
jgi:ferredoxin